MADPLKDIQQTFIKICKERGGKINRLSSNKLICKLNDEIEMILWDRELTIIQHIKLTQKYISDVEELKSLM